MQANEERQGNVEMIRKLRNYQKTRSYRDYAPKHVWEQSKLDNSSILFLHQEEEINLYAENIRCLEIKKGLEKRMDPKQCTIRPSFGQKFAINTEDTVKSKFNLCLKIKPNHGLEMWMMQTFFREAMPIQEEGKASGKPPAKARPILEPSSISGWDSIPMEQRQWIDIEIWESKDPHCFQVSKFTSRLLLHGNQVCGE